MIHNNQAKIMLRVLVHYVSDKQVRELRKKQQPRILGGDS